MTGRHAAPGGARPGDGLVRAGAVLFGLGVLAVLGSVVPAVVTGGQAPGGLVVAAGTLLPLGLGTALAGLLRSARSARRAARRAARRSANPT